MVKFVVNHIGYVMEREVDFRPAQDTLTGSETIIADLEDGTRLLRRDDGGGIVYETPEQWPEGEEQVQTFEMWDDARLYFGLWMETGGFTTGESPSQWVPVSVAASGQEALAAYLLVGTGTKNSRQWVARTIGVTKQTVSNYCNRVRYKNE